MIRYYQLGNVTLSVKELPKDISDGKFLEIFRDKSRNTDIEINIDLSNFEIPNDANYTTNDCRFLKNNIQYLVGMMCEIGPAVCVPTLDWKKDKINIQVNPEVCDKEYFTVNQIFSLSGLHSGLLYRGCGTFHCSYVSINGKATLFAGRSGVGKSTQAALWEKYRNAEIINGDRALIFKENGVWYAGGISVCGSSNICVNKTLPIEKVVILEHGDANEVYQMSAMQKYRAVLSGLAFQQWLKEEVDEANELTMKFISEVPIYRYSCLPNESAVEELENKLG